MEGYHPLGNSPLGLESGVVRLVACDLRRPGLYEAEAARLVSVIQPLSLRLEHIGSTAVPGLAAKRVIDILAGCDDPSALPARIAALVGGGYQIRGEQGIPGREFFCRGDPRAYHLHMVSLRSQLWCEHLAFCSWLRSSPVVREDYAVLKQSPAARRPHDREAYIEGKAPFIRAALRRIAEGREGCVSGSLPSNGPAPLPPVVEAVVQSSGCRAGQTGIAGCLACPASRLRENRASTGPRPTGWAQAFEAHSMNPSGYVTLLTSIVLALGITRIFTGIGKIVQLRRKEGTDLREYSYVNHRGLFILAALLPPIDAIDTFLKGPGSLRRPGTALHLHVAGRLHIERDRRLDKARTIPCGVRRVVPALYARLHQHQSPRADLRRDWVSTCYACVGLAFPWSRHRGSPDVASCQGGGLRSPA